MDKAFKLTQAYADPIITSLRSIYDVFGQSFEGRKVLDFGCHWGYFARHLLMSQRAREVHGVDVIPLWEAVTELDLTAIEGLKLFAGDILTLPELQRESYDMIVSSGT